MNTPAGWVAIVGESISRHENWGAALDQVAVQLGIERADIWFQDRPDLIWLFDGPPGNVSGPAAVVFDPVQFQRAKSRGDLEDEQFPQLANRFMLHINQTASNLAFAGQERHLLPGFEPNLQTMKKTQPEPTVYLVLLRPHIVWKGKAYIAGQTVEIVPHGSAEEKKVARLLTYKHVRVATDEDRQAAAAAVLVDNADASAAAEPAEPAAGFALLDPLTVAPSPVNPRRHFGDASMQELTDSVKTSGVRVPINVRAMPAGQWFVEPGKQSGKDGWFLMDRRRFRPATGSTGGQTYEHLPDEIFQHFFPTQAQAEAAKPKWEIIAGERRWRAARYTGRETIRAVVETMGDLEAAELQVVENDQREDLSPLESAAGYQYLLDQPGYNIKKLVERTGKSKTIIYERLKLLELPKLAQDAVIAGRLPMSTAQLIGAAAPEIREKAAAVILGVEDEDGDRFDYRKGDEPEVETFREAEDTIKSLSADAESDRKRKAMREQLTAEGFTVLDDNESARVVYYGGRLQHGCGYLLANEVCERDPKGRTWEKVLKGTAATRYAAVHGGRYDREVEAVRIYKREEANEALKKLGLWEAEGSKAAKEKLEKQREKAREENARAQMHANFDAIVEQARKGETAQVRAALQAAVAVMTSRDNSDVEFVCERRGWKPKTAHYGARSKMLQEHAGNTTIRELCALVAELAAASLGDTFHHRREATETVGELFGVRPAKVKSPDVRKGQASEAGKMEEATI